MIIDNLRDGVIQNSVYLNPLKPFCLLTSALRYWLLSHCFLLDLYTFSVLSLVFFQKSNIIPNIAQETSICEDSVLILLKSAVLLRYRSIGYYKIFLFTPSNNYVFILCPF